MTVSTLLDSVVDLASAAEGLPAKSTLLDTDGGWRVMLAIVRQISVPLRKLCLDNEGALLKNTIASPTFHPLGGRKGRYRRATMAWRSERRELTLGDATGKTQNVVVPETEHEIEIGRLYGVHFLDGGWCSIHSPFDPGARAISMDAWLDAKALQVNSVSYTIRDTLKLVADYEGAHTNELLSWVAVGVNPEAIDRGRDMKYRLVNSVRFGCLSYAQLVVLYTALYLVEKMKKLLAESGGDAPAVVGASSVERTIRHLRTDLVLRARMVNATHEMIVVGESDMPRSRRRHPVYRLWSGSAQWDAPVSRPHPPDQP